MKRECTAFVEDKNNLSVRTVQAIGQSAVSRFPAPGFRYYATGELGGVGNNGYSWSSTVRGNGGMDLNFLSQYISLNAANGFAHGFQLRCLSE
ncbi:hypothetical protein [uncultured Rikenella sp.]|uniref:hypothetical protein n=1 Tax=uncultured Rikenella sp. TaxID=368003 RepID=UPI0026037FF9|nr:hypothetical protein [uncultured Rikenella sp.]